MNNVQRDRMATLRRLAVCLCVLLLAVGCGPTQIEGTSIRIASADTPQNQLLGQLAMIMLREHGYQVTDHTDLRNESAVRGAMVAGSVDICWAYTGDTWSDHLDHDIPISSPDQLYQLVRAEDELHGIIWLSPAPHGRSLSVLMAPARARELDIVTLTDLANYVRARDSGLSLVTPTDLRDASTALRGLEGVYGFGFRDDRVTTDDTAERYARAASGEFDCVLGYAYDSELYEHALQPLVDDRAFFVYSKLAVGVRARLLGEYPNLESQLMQLAAALDDAAMIDMGRQVLVENKSPESVARRFLRRQHLIGPTPEPSNP